MAIASSTQYFTRIITLDKQGNTVAGSQQAVTTDGIHNSDIYTDLQQNFKAHAGLAITLPAGANGNQILKYSVTDWLSGNCAYSNVTGLFTAGAAGKFIFSGQAEINGLLASGALLTMRLAIKQNASIIWYGPNAVGIADAGAPASTTYSLCAGISGSLNLAVNDTVGLVIYWVGLTGDSIIASENCFFQGQVLPG